MTTNSSSKFTIYTIGHSNLTWKNFLFLLVKHDIDTLIDVRSYPFSSFVPYFNRSDDKLPKYLSGAKILYMYKGDKLGGRPNDPSFYKDGKKPTGKANYLKLVDYDKIETMPWYQQNIDELIDIARKSKTVIMCSEEDPFNCHRQILIGKTLVKNNIKVHHIRGYEDIYPESTDVQVENQTVLESYLD